VQKTAAVNPQGHCQVQGLATVGVRDRRLTNITYRLLFFFNTRHLNELMIVTADVYRTIWIYSSQHWRVQQDLVQLTVNTPPCLLTASLAAARASYAVASSTSSSLLQLLVAVFSLSYQQEEAGYT